MALFDVENVY